MRFLIVNGYCNDRAGLTKFEFFKQQVIEVFSSLDWQIIKRQKELIDTENEFYIRDRDSVEDFLYEQENSHIKQETGKQFDQMDVIFIGANNNAHPWALSMRRILTLMKMCLKTNKLLFCSAFGAQALAFLCASNLTTNIRITNNLGNGCKLSDFSKYVKHASKTHSDEYFLDSTTGDIYTYSYETDEWIPKFNAGIHNRRDAMEYQSIGKYIVKSPTYKPREPSSLTLCLDANETVCRIKKNYYHHWAFQDIDPQFVVPLNNQWDIHTFTFINPERKFAVLAECNQHGPMIIECKNIMASMFDPSLRYKSTITLLENFVANALRIVKHDTAYNTISVVNDRFFANQNGLLQNIDIAHLNNKKHFINGNPEQILRTQQHNFLIEQRQLSGMRDIQSDDPGFSVKKSRLPDFVSQNFMQQKKLKVKETTSRVYHRSMPTMRLSHLEIETPINNTINKKHVQIVSSRQTPQSVSRKYMPILKKSTPMLAQEFSVMEDKVFTQQDVRNALHPDLDRSYTGKQRLWVPGQYSITRALPSRATILSTNDDQQLTPQSVWTHQFRERSRKKWLVSQDFIV